MKMTEHHREALRQARRYIGNDRNMYICLALSRVDNYRSRPDVARAARDIKPIIRQMLGKHAMLEDWQAENGWYGRNARADRLDWIDWMLQQDEL